MLHCLSVFSIAALLLVTPVAAATGVSGTITTTTWEKALSPYRVTDTITVPSGNVLTIEPGVDILFDADVQFVVQGKLYAVGTYADSIRFLKGTAVNWRGIRITGGDTSTIAHMRISGGKARGSTRQDSCGGALFLSGKGTRAGMSNSVISGNSSTAWWPGGGGVMNSENAALTMTNCTVSSNSTSGYGGGVHSGNKAALTMTNCTVSGNKAVNGGGAFNSSATLTMMNCAVSGNKASYFGGGVASYSGSLTMMDCTISGNSAWSPGGAVLNDFSATLTMTNCTISRNSSHEGGGFVYNANNAKLTITNSILWANSAPTEPEIRRQSGAITIRNSDVQGGIPSGVTDGGGNINADPLFVNPSMGDYHLQGGSPARDMGAFPWPVAVIEQDPVPRFYLWQNHPNPFNPSTAIHFSLSDAGLVSLAVYDVNGRLVRTLVDNTLANGQYEIVWNGTDDMGWNVASGVYLCRLIFHERALTGKMTLVR